VLPGVSGIVCIVALTLDEKLLLVEQWRQPVGAYVVELVGDGIRVNVVAPGTIDTVINAGVSEFRQNMLKHRIPPGVSVLREYATDVPRIDAIAGERQERGQAAEGGANQQ
jgi:hypothetical protein